MINEMTRIFLAIAGALGGLSVVFGAFASHALKDKLSERALEIWETGTKYQMYHALALLLVALLLSRLATTSLPLVIAGYAFIVGILLFSGSLYALSLSGIKWLGAITPLGGVAFILGWVCLVVAAWQWE
jgi:uncharacterized membrane protein YgdD (TMEM256/DUF423 family)